MDVIVPGLFVGPGMDLYGPDKGRIEGAVLICVSEGVSGLSPAVHHIPFFTDTDENGDRRASIERLDEIAKLIDESLKNGGKAFVFCGAGMERSPLAVTWYLHKYRKLTLKDAWTLVKTYRREAMNRLDWLPGKYTAGIKGE